MAEDFVSDDIVSEELELVEVSDEEEVESDVDEELDEEPEPPEDEPRASFL